MAVRDIVSNLKTVQAFNAAISTDTTTTGAIIDTADFEAGFAVFLQATAYTDGTYTLALTESDSSTMVGAVTIDSSKLIGSLPAVSAATASGGTLGKVGVFSNLRYIQISIVSTSTTTGATINATVVQSGEYLPV